MMRETFETECDAETTRADKKGARMKTTRLANPPSCVRRRIAIVTPGHGLLKGNHGIGEIPEKTEKAADDAEWPHFCRLGAMVVEGSADSSFQPPDSAHSDVGC